MAHEKFTGFMHAHEPIMLSVKTRKQAERLAIMLEMLDEHSENAPPIPCLIMLTPSRNGHSVVLCRACLQIARQQMLEITSVIADMLLIPSVEEEKAERTHGRKEK